MITLKGVKLAMSKVQTFIAKNRISLLLFAGILIAPVLGAALMAISGSHEASGRGKGDVGDLH